MTAGMRVVVTGSSGHFAAALLPALCALREVGEVRGIDVRPPHFHHEKFRAVVRDVRDPALTQMMTGCDALVHLAFVVLRGRTAEREMRDSNVAGTRHVFESAHRCRVKRLVQFSSAAVYGSGVNVDEGAAYDPLPGFLYARHKVEVEQYLQSRFPECVRLRPHAILGPHAQPLLRRLLQQPFYLRLPDPPPLLQCVHEDDVARAVLLALAAKVRGPFNLSAPDAFSFRDAVQRDGRFSIGLPSGIARAGFKLAWRLFGWGGEPAWLEGLSRPLLLDCSRAASKLGWQAGYSAAAAIRSIGVPRAASGAKGRVEVP
ncbi:MAG: NAD-dependent epimerase/dehydratase family protein [Betaproteobacteria bacterium]